MNDAIKLKLSDRRVKTIVTACYPDWKGRKVKARAAKQYSMSNFWDGGSRDYVVAYDPATGQVSQPSFASTNPFTKTAHTTVEIPPGVLLVEHSINMGKDGGITIHVNPASAAAFLPGYCITDEQKATADRLIETTL